MEAASYLAQNGGLESVTVVGHDKVPLGRVLGPTVGSLVRQMHEAAGVRFQLERSIAKFLPSETDAASVGSVELDSGETLPASLVVVGAGVIPATAFVSGVDTAPDGSLLVDSSLRVKGTSNVWAAGDIARFPAPWAEGEPLRVEHWNVAMDQGRVAGRAMAGRDAAYDNVPFFWTVQYGKSIRYCGHATRWDREIVLGSVSEGAFLVAYADDAKDKVLAVSTLGADPAAVAAHALMREGRMPRASEMDGKPLSFLPDLLRGAAGK